MMKSRTTILTIVIVSLLAFSSLTSATLTTSAYAQESTELAHVYQDRVRFSSPSGTNEWRVQVFNAEQKKLFDSGFVPNQVLDWNMKDMDGQSVSEGFYSYSFTLRDADGKKSKQPSGNLAIAGSSDSREQAPPLAGNEVSINATAKSIKGIGTPGRVPVFTADDTIGDSNIFDVNGRIGIGTSVPTANFDIVSPLQPPLPSSGSSGGVVLNVRGGAGGDTTGTTGSFGGQGALVIIRSGNGGNAPAGSTNGRGGNVLIQLGRPGIGTGSPGLPGNLLVTGGNVGIGDFGGPTGGMITSQLTVLGTIESKEGGFRFPDGSLQLTAAIGGGGGTITGVTAGMGLTGGGTSGDVTLAIVAPLSLTSSSGSAIFTGTNNGNGAGVIGSSADGGGVAGFSNTKHGVDGITHSTVGFAGVHGFSDGNGFGVLGQATNNAGVLGAGQGAAGTFSPGVLGTSINSPGMHATSNNAQGLFAKGLGPAGTFSPGVQAESANSPGVHATSTNSPGVHATSNNAQGLFGQGLGPAGTYSPGVQAVSINSPGVDATSNNAQGLFAAGLGPAGTFSPGVHAVSINSQGVIGESTNRAGVHATSNNAQGLFAQGLGPVGTFSPGVQAESANSPAVTATSNNAQGVFAQGLGPAGTYSPGVQALSTNSPGVQAVSINSQGVFGESTNGAGVAGYSTNGIGVYGEGPTAGVFQGNVNINGNLSKSSGTFKIDHPLDPENKYLYHSFIESPDMMNIYNGVVVLDKKGRAIVEMPDYFQALNKDFRYQLTAIGAPGPNLYIAKEIAGNRFVIAGGLAGMKVSWQVTGVRQDAWANAHRIKTEEEKPSGERGSYLHPELFNQSTEKAVGLKHAFGATPRMKGSAPNQLLSAKQ